MKPPLWLVRREGISGGGAEKVVARFSRMFADSFDVRVVHAGSRIEGRRIGGTSGSSWWRALAFARGVNRLLAGRRGGVVLSFERGIKADIYRAGDGVHRAWLERRPGGWARRSVNPLHWVYPCLEARTMRESRVVVANSGLVADELRRFHPQSPAAIRVIRNGFDPAVYFPGAIRAASAWPERLLFVGSGWERKGLAVALEWLAAFREVNRGVRLRVAGHGRPEAFHPLARRLGVLEAVDFLGRVGDPAEEYRQADLFVLPTAYDPFSNATLEALASGCPVATRPGNGAVEVLDEGRNGFVDRTGSPEALVTWWARVGRTLRPDGVAATVAGETTDRERRDYLDLFGEITSGLG